MRDNIKEIYENINYDEKLPPIEKRKALLQVRNDRLFHDLFNENDMDTLEWVVMQILECSYEEIHGNVHINNVRLVNTYQEERGKYVDLVVDYKGEKIIIEMNNNYVGNYMKNLLYSFNVISNYYNVGTSTIDFSKIRAKAILVNLNWHSKKELASMPPKEEITLPYPEETLRKEKDFLLKIINVNLDFYHKLNYNEVDRWDELWKLLTINNYQEMDKFIKDINMLNYYRKKLYTLSNNEGYLELIMNDDIRRNAEIEGYYNAGVLEGIERGIERGITSNRNEMVMNMHKENIPIETISKCANITLDEVMEIINQNRF